MGLEDQQIADVATFVRSRFGNDSPPITTEEVKAVRSATAGRTTFWTMAELLKK
jgi:mono/diheme cytochrome c family protein